jgi:hypothetical protein
MSNAELASNLRNNDVAGAELHRGMLNFLAASAKSGGRGNDRRNDDDAFQTLHGLLSSFERRKPYFSCTGEGC